MQSELFKKLVSGDKAALAKAITLVESNNPEHCEIAEKLLQEASRVNKKSLRIAITGIPGAGKSTFINTLGTWLVNAQKQKVCVLAIDPSSKINKGSILGDKTRMNELAVLPNAFIRPTPTGGISGGISQKTFETILLCEAAGFDTILLETVGTGQSETEADNVSDCIVLLLMADTGDELQGIKRGIMETADIVVLNKADILSPIILKSAENELKNAFNYLSEKNKGWIPPVIINSFNDKAKINEIWNSISQFITFQTQSGNYSKKRKNQSKYWFTEQLKYHFERVFFNDTDIERDIELYYQKPIENRPNSDIFLKELLKKWLNKNKV